MPNKHVMQEWRRIIEDEGKPPEQRWGIAKDLTNDEVAKGIQAANNEYADCFIQDAATDKIFLISHFTIWSDGDKREYAVNYFPFDSLKNQPIEDIILTLPAKEFFDGRFRFDQKDADAKDSGVVPERNNPRETYQPWVIDLTEEDSWTREERFTTKEEAVRYGRENFHTLFEEEMGNSFQPDEHEKSFVIGRIEPFVPSVQTDSVIDNIIDQAYSEVGEVAESYLESVSKEEEAFLEERLNDAFREWMDETDNHPTFWKVVDIEQIKG